MILYKVLRFLRKRCSGEDLGKWYKGHLPLMTPREANVALSTALDSGKPYMAARLGSVEIKPVLYYERIKKLPFGRLLKLYLSGDIDDVLGAEKYESHMIDIMCNNAGFFPEDVSLLPRFARMMKDDITEMDLCGAWLNEYLLKDYFRSSVEFCDLGSLEPYDFDAPWTSHLAGKKVLVIHPFADTIERQYLNRELIWDNPLVLPDFHLITLKAVQSIAHENVPFHTWFDALEDMERRMDSIVFDVAIIGCGAYGLPLAAHAKRTGHVAIHLGGPVQLLFGIKGRRWDNIPEVSKFYNDYWVRPSASETPVKNHTVENGCYW